MATVLADTEISHDSDFNVTLTATSAAATAITAIDAATTKVVDGNLVTTLTGTAAVSYTHLPLPTNREV